MGSAPTSTDDAAGADTLPDDLVLPAVLRPALTPASIRQNLGGGALILLGTFSVALALHAGAHRHLVDLFAGLALAAAGVVLLAMLWTSTLHLDANGFSYDVLGLRRAKSWSEVRAVVTTTKRHALSPGIGVVLPPPPTSDRERRIDVPDIFSIRSGPLADLMRRLHAASIRTEA